MERDSVRNLMMWCMDHSDSAEEVYTHKTTVYCILVHFACLLCSVNTCIECSRILSIFGSHTVHV